MTDIMEQCTKLKVALEGINDNISKILDIQQQMQALSSKGFNVGPSIDSLDVQKKEYTEFITGATEDLEKLVKRCEDMSLNIH